MRRELEEIISKKPSTLKSKLKNSIQTQKTQYIVLGLLAILTNREIASIINNHIPTFFGMGFNDFYSDNYNSIAFSAIAGIIAIIIPVILSLYDTAKRGSPISKHFVQDNFTHQTIIFPIIIIVLSLVSRNNVFVFTLIILLVFDLYKKTKKYFNLIFYNKEVVTQYLKDSAIKHEDSKVLFVQNIINDVEKIFKKNFNLNDSFDYSSEYISFSSKSNIVSVNNSSLRNWINELKKYDLESIEIIKENEHFTARSFSELVIKDKIKATLSYDPELRYLILYIYFEEGSTLSDPKKLEKLKKDLDEGFKRIFTYSEKNTSKDKLLDEYDKYLYLLLKQHDFVALNEALELLELVFNISNESNSQYFYKIARINYNLYNLYNDFSHTKATSNIFLNYWERMLKITTKYPERDYVRWALEDLASGIKNNFYTDEDLGRLDKIFTDFYKHEKLTESFVFNFINGIISISVSLMRHEENIEKNTINAIKVLTFLKFLNKDIKDFKKFNYFNYTDEEIEQISKLADQGIVLAVAFLTTEYKEKIKDLSPFYALISPSTYLKTIQEVYLKEDKLWDMSRWRHHKFDRHGIGGGWGFSAIEFFKNYTISYAKSARLSASHFTNFVVNPNAIYLFQEIEKQIRAEDATNPLLAQFKSLNDKAKEQEEESIIRSELDNEKIQTFFNDIENSYSKEGKLSSLFSSETIDRVTPDDSMGIYTIVPKKYFLTDPSNSPESLSSYGARLATGENRAISELIQEEKPLKDISLEYFYKTIFPNLLLKSENKLYIFLGKTYRFRTQHFSWRDDKCVFNDEITITNNDHANKSITILEIMYRGKVHKIHLVAADNMDFDRFYSIEKDAIKIEYLKYPSPEGHYKYGINNLFLEISNISNAKAIDMFNKAPDNFHGIDESDKIKNLELSITLKIFSSVKIKLLKEFESYKLLTNTKDDDDDD